MFSHFFIERPIFASVLSIVITLAGAVAVMNLPVSQYPPITPPSINVMCTYPAPTPTTWPTRWPPPLSSRSTASKTCCTWCRSPTTTAPTT